MARWSYPYDVSLPWTDLFVLCYYGFMTTRSNTLTVLILGIAFLTLPFIHRQQAYAAVNFRQGDTVVLGADETIDENYFAAGEYVAVNGIVNGDAYLVGGNVLVDGTVNGDVIAAGGTVTVIGDVTGDVRAAGGQITVSGIVGGNITSLGGQISLEESANLSGSLTAAGGNIAVRTVVPRGLQAAAGNVLLDGTVGGNMVFAGGHLRLGPDSGVGGDLTYVSDEQAVIDPTAGIGGTVSRIAPPPRPRFDPEVPRRVATMAFVAWEFVSFVTALVIGYLLTLVAPNFIARVSARLGKGFLASVGTGFILALLMPVLALVLFLSVIGIPLSIMVMVLFGLSFYAAKIMAAVFLGSVILRRTLRHERLSGALVLGLLVYYLLLVIPVIGFLIKGILALGGLGALYLEKRDTLASLHGKRII